MEDVDRSRSRHPPSPMRVTSSALDPRRHWYVVSKDLCGSRPKEFAKGEVFRHFPDEICHNFCMAELVNFNARTNTTTIKMAG